MNTANKITLFRVILIPLFLLVCYLDFPYHLPVALAIFILASLSDFLDGYIARRYNLVTKFGKVMDPLADKLMLMTTLFCLYATGRIPLWVPIVICVKECSMITHLESADERDDLLDELSDRYGELPAPVSNLVDISLLRNAASLLGFASVEQKGALLSFFSDIVAPWHTYVLTVATAVAILAMIIYGIIIVRTNPQLFRKPKSAR